MSVRVQKSGVYQIVSGRIRGLLYNIDNCRSYVACLGIPYAKAPEGDLRFKKPEPPRPWKNVRNCQHFGAACPYEELPGQEFKPRVAHSEDCLFLNVFAPHNPRSRLPVFVFIHGGGFVFDNAANYGDANICNYVCSKEVVVVTFNYRLGLLGFGTTNDNAARGNFGLWDQTAALRWVRDNISVFGGDPDNVTVGGHSAGSASADLLALSPHSRNLFHRLVLLGGAANCGFAVHSAEKVRKMVVNFATKQGYKSVKGNSKEAESKEVMSFLKNMPVKDLASSFLGGPNWAPTIDGDFFPKPLEELRREAPKKEIIAGVTMFEGLNLAAAGKKKDDLSQATVAALSQLLKERGNKAKAKQLFDRVLDGKFKAGSEDYNKFCVHVLGDFFINNGVWESAVNWQKCGSKVYLFTLDYLPEGMMGGFGRFLPFLECCHGVDVNLLLGMNMFADVDFKPEDTHIIHNFASYFARFFATGNPNAPTSVEKWLPIDSINSTRQLLIKGNIDTPNDNFCDRRPKQWIHLREKEFYTPKL